jgi:hypothetical protein
MTDDLVKRWEANTVSGSNEECWAWVGKKIKKDDRGVISINGKNVTAPRLTWYVTHGEWPAQDMFVCHSCDNPNCVNPKHLWLGTNKDNIQDAASKGRLGNQKNSDHLKGSLHPNAKLNEQTVISMRSDRAAGMTIRAIAAKYSMTYAPTWLAVTGKGWGHV